MWSWHLAGSGCATLPLLTCLRLLLQDECLQALAPLAAADGICFNATGSWLAPDIPTCDRQGSNCLSLGRGLRDTGAARFQAGLSPHLGATSHCRNCSTALRAVTQNVDTKNCLSKRTLLAMARRPDPEATEQVITM